VNFILEWTTNSQGRRRGIALLFLKLGARWRGGWSTTRPGRFTLGNFTRAGLDGCGKSCTHRE